MRVIKTFTFRTDFNALMPIYLNLLTARGKNRNIPPTEKMRDEEEVGEGDVVFPSCVDKAEREGSVPVKTGEHH